MEAQLLIDTPGFTVSGRMQAPDGTMPRAECPLIVAIHGGGFTAAYFDIEGYSLLERAGARGYGVIGLDRLGHGRSRADGMDAQSFANNRVWIDEAIARLWPQFEAQCSGVVLVGHSIGAALALMVAAMRPSWPLAGVAVSGAALAGNPALSGYFGGLPSVPWIQSPATDKDRLMLGAAGTFNPAVTDLLHPAYEPISTQELGEIYTVWTQGAPDFLRAIAVPVQYRMGAQDALWTVDEGAMADLAGHLSGSAGSSASIVPDAGHAIDFHEAGAAFQDAQLDFARDCVRGRAG